MTITIELSPEIESDLRHAAANAGVSPGVLAAKILQQGLGQSAIQTPVGKQLPRTESDLMQQINSSLSQIEWKRYHALISKRNAETLTADEQRTLIEFTDEIEKANVRRMQALAELARLRQMSLRDLMNELGLTPAAHD